MPVRLVAVSFDAPDPASVATFWATLLERAIVDEASGALVPGDDTQVGLRFVAASTKRSGQSHLHLHLTSSTPDDQQRTVERALELGGRHLDVGQLPDEPHVVLADPGGNEFCVIEPGNKFLAGCGFLGEVACDGSRDVGLFWRSALRWPLVWDQDEETAVQSPRGGTKLSWGGPPVSAKTGRNRQRFDLATAELAAEVQRLVGLGATHVGEHAGGVELADPDGNEFSLRLDQPRCTSSSSK
jgi:Glyoxalase-like domain